MAMCEAAPAATLQPGGGPVEVAPHLWWVGHPLDADAVGCHSYLWAPPDGDAVLIDPGSALTVVELVANVSHVCDWSRVRWLVAQHPDPDVIAALSCLADVAPRDAQLVTHSRASVLLRHMGYRWEPWVIDVHGLALPDGSVRFVPTPYAHHPAAFTTWLPQAGVLCTSDLFGAFRQPGDPLVACSAHVLGPLRVFHEHYVPSAPILAAALRSLQDLGPEVIAPQHGYILHGDLLAMAFDALATVHGGLYLGAAGTADVHRLERLARAESYITRVLATSARFPSACEEITEALRVVAPLAHVTPVVTGPSGPRVPTCAGGVSAIGRLSGPAHIVETPEGQVVYGWTRPMDVDADLSRMLATIAEPMVIAAVRYEALLRTQAEAARLSRQATHDTLTGVANRCGLDAAARAFVAAGRPFCIAMADLDHFKVVNDTYGHGAGDYVLCTTAHAIVEAAGPHATVGRWGGEEFVVISPEPDAEALGERIRAAVAEADVHVQNSCAITVSVGLARVRDGEGWITCLDRADSAMYAAKHTGRDRIVIAE